MNQGFCPVPSRTLCETRWLSVSRNEFGNEESRADLTGRRTTSTAQETEIAQAIWEPFLPERFWRKRLLQP
jgi:hypothetical protein